MPYTPASRRLAHERFAARLQAALSVEEVQQAYLTHVHDVLFARSTGLYHLRPEDRRPIGVVSDAPVDFLEHYEEEGRENDLVLRYVVDRMRPIDSSRVVSRERWEGSTVRRVLQGAGFYHSMEAPVVASGMICGTINFARRGEDDGFTRADLAAARRISEQLGLAMERAMRYEETGRRARLLEDALDRLPQAVVVTDLDAQVLFSNRAAGKRPRRDAPPLAELARTRIAETMHDFRVKGSRARTSSLVDPGSGVRVVVKSLRLPDRAGASVTVVYVSGDEQSPGLPAWDVLSPREQQIARLVSEGLTTKQIAERAFITENTVKQHLKRIFAKTDVRNRAELMQRIWVQSAQAE